MQVKDRNGEIAFENVKWRKPVAMLINGGTRSGKEVLAYGFKKYRLGEIIGTRTEGAVLAATAFLIGDGLLLLSRMCWSMASDWKGSVSHRPSKSKRPLLGGGAILSSKLRSRCCLTVELSATWVGPGLRIHNCVAADYAR
jgi:hypothetical protein